MLATQRLNKLETLREMNESLRSVQRNVSGHLESNRAFPLFRYMSNDELLEIVSQAAQDPRAIIPHLKKMAIGHQIGTVEIHGPRGSILGSRPKYCECGCYWADGHGCTKQLWKVEPPLAEELPETRKSADHTFRLYTQAELIELIRAAAVGC